MMKLNKRYQAYVSILKAVFSTMNLMCISFLCIYFQLVGHCVTPGSGCLAPSQKKNHLGDLFFCPTVTWLAWHCSLVVEEKMQPKMFSSSATAFFFVFRQREREWRGRKRQRD